MIFVDDDSREVERESNKGSENKNDNETGIKDSIISVYERKGNVVYINVRVRLCAATPASIIGNGTPPSPSQKHHFTHKHQINFCN